MAKINFKGFMKDIKKGVSGAKEATGNIVKTMKTNRKSRGNVDKIVAKRFEKAGMSQSPQNVTKFKFEVKKEKKKRGL